MAINKKLTAKGLTVYIADFRDKDGKRFRKWFNTEKEARDWEKVSLAEVVKGEFIPPSTELVKDLAHQWLENKKAMRRKDGTTVHQWSSLDYWQYHLNNFVLPELGHLRISDANDVERIEKAFKAWSARVSTYQCCKAATTLARIFDLAVRYRKIGMNCARIAERPKVSFEDDPQEHAVEDDEVYSKAELQRIITAAQGGFERVLVMLLAFTGMRISEVLGLTWDYVDLKERKIYVRQKLGISEGAGLRLAPVKSKAGRRTFDNLPALLVRELTAWKLKCAPSPEKFVLCTVLGKPLNRKHTWNLLQKITKRAEVWQAGHHTLRHTFASQLLKDGVDDVTVARLLGHADTTITRRVYIHFIRDDKAAPLAGFASSIMGD